MGRRLRLRPILFKSIRKLHCIDNLYTGRKENIADLIGKERFYFIEADICDFNGIMSLANYCDEWNRDVVINLHQD